MKKIETLLQELEREALVTRRVLERIPDDDRLAWRPHEKARTLGQLALHVATVPEGVARFVASPSPAQAPRFDQDPAPASAAELVPTLEQSVAAAREALAGLDDDALDAPWKLVDGDRELFETTRWQMLRSIMLNHWYHHRGQLTVYLRALGLGVPSIYGPSADENPFA